MKITIEFDERLKPILAKMLSPAFDRTKIFMRLMSGAAMTDDECKQHMEAYSILTALDIELNVGTSTDATITPLKR